MFLVLKSLIEMVLLSTLNICFGCKKFESLKTKKKMDYCKPASKFGDFKRLTYWRSLILAVSQFNALLKKLFYSHTEGARVAHFQMWFP